MIITLGAMMLFYTDSRASWLAAGCEVVFFASWLLLRRKKRLITIALVIIAVLAGGYVLRDLPDDESFKIRAAYNINSLAIVKDHPLGVGVGAWKLAYPHYAHALVQTPPGGFGETLRPSRAHNDLMQAFVELGILGGLAYIVIFFMLIQTAWKIGGRMVLCLSTAVVGLGANALMDFPLQLPLSPIVFWTFAGMIAGLSKNTSPNP
jgi:O-antigen ligase